MGTHTETQDDRGRRPPQRQASGFPPSCALPDKELDQPAAQSMADRVDSFDWASTALGPRAEWPPELETVVCQILDSGFPKAVVWGPELTTIYNDGFRPILGDKPDALGRSFADVWAEVWDQIGPIAERAYAGSPTYIEDFPLVIDRFGSPEEAWFTFCYSPLRLSDGSVVGMLDTVVETTATVRARTELSMVNRELGHRLKNTLTLVQAIASQTLRNVREKECLEAFDERLAALGHAHEILLRQNWSQTSFLQVVAQALEPHDGLNQIEISGSDRQIGSRAATTLAMILHELATNAVKYGALSTPQGRVSVDWTIKDSRLCLSWRETDGPQVSEPREAGFGTHLIDRAFGNASQVSRSYSRAGFHLTLNTPLEELED